MALIKPLAKMNIETTTSLEVMVAKVIENKHGMITFSDKDLPLGGRNHSKALLIPTEMRGEGTNYVMVDDGSAINVCPLNIMPNLGLKVDDLANSDQIIRAYDNCIRSVDCTFQTLVKIGPV